MVYGNSHVRAIKEAHELRSQEIVSRMPNLSFDIKLLCDDKIEGSIGEIGVPAALEGIKRSNKEDIIVLAIGGTQHNILGLLQHDVAYDIAPFASLHDPSRTIIPRNMLRTEFEDLVRERRLIPIFKNSTVSSVYHIAPPPPQGRRGIHPCSDGALPGCGTF